MSGYLSADRAGEWPCHCPPAGRMRLTSTSQRELPRNTRTAGDPRMGRPRPRPTPGPALARPKICPCLAGGAVCLRSCGVARRSGSRAVGCVTVPCVAPQSLQEGYPPRCYFFPARLLVFQRSTYSVSALRTTSDAVALNPVSRCKSSATRCALFQRSSSIRTGLTGVFMRRLSHVSLPSSTRIRRIAVHYT